MKYLLALAFSLMAIVAPFTITLAQGATPTANPTSSSTAIATATTTPVLTTDCSQAGNSGGDSLFAIYPPWLRSADGAQNAGIDCIGATIWFYIDKLLIVVAIGAFFYLLYGAFLYVSAFGDEAKVKQGRATITNALIGVVLAVLAYFIISLVQSALNVKP